MCCSMHSVCTVPYIMQRVYITYAKDMQLNFIIIICVCEPEPDRGVTQPLFYSSCSTLHPNSYFDWCIPPYPEELGFVATHGDNDERVHLRPPPPNWADGHWPPMRSSPNVLLILDGTPTFHCSDIESTWEGLTLGPVFTVVKLDWSFGTRWNSMPVALCDEGLLCSNPMLCSNGDTMLCSRPSLPCFEDSCSPRCFAASLQGFFSALAALVPCGNQGGSSCSWWSGAWMYLNHPEPSWAGQWTVHACFEEIWHLTTEKKTPLQQQFN